MTRPRVAINMGDPAGVGPEVALKALREPGVYEHCRPVVFGTPAALEREAAARGVERELEPARGDLPLQRGRRPEDHGKAVLVQARLLQRPERDLRPDARRIAHGDGHPRSRHALATS